MVLCDYLIIGGGKTGLKLAENLNKLEKKIILVEKNRLGGTNLLQVEIPREQFYLETKNFARVIKYFSSQNEIANKLYEAREVVSDRIQKNIVYKSKVVFNKLNFLGYVNVLFGEANLLTKNTASIIMEDKNIIIKFKKCILATGREVVEVSYIDGVENVRYLTKYNIFFLEKIPTHLAIVGFTSESIEVASFYSSLGIEVTIFEKKSKKDVFPNVDKSLFNHLISKLLHNYVNIHFEYEVVSLDQDGESVIITTKNDGSFGFSDLYLHVKEFFDNEQKWLKNIHLKYSSKGISVNKSNQSNISNIYSFGSNNISRTTPIVLKESILQLIESEQKNNKLKYKNFPTKILDSAFEIVSSIPRKNTKYEEARFELGYFLDSVGMGMTESEAVGKYGPRVKVREIKCSARSELLKLVYLHKSKKLIGYWASAYFKQHFNSLLYYTFISQSNCEDVLDVINFHNEC